MRILTIGLAGLILVVVLTIRGSSGVLQERRAVRDSSEVTESKATPMYSKSGYDITSLSREEIEQLARKLTAQERHVILDNGTERAFTGALLENKEAGVYTCRLCGLPLFSSETKFKSGTGWPSYWAPVAEDHVRRNVDQSLGMRRVEVRCTRCDAHLGHLFDDGPKPTGHRYCLNSTSLRFAPADSALPPESRPIQKRTAYFAGGCFWGVEDRFQQVPGVLDAVSGYMGGRTSNPTYKDICTGRTEHAETVRLTFDPKRVAYSELLAWFFKFHDPTQLNRQGPDVGTQYRSAIFTIDESQGKEARGTIDQLSKSDRFAGRKIVTTIQQAGPFFEAEEYHQDYHAKNGGSCALP